MHRKTRHIGLLIAGLLSLAATACTLRIPDGNAPDVPLVFDPVMYIPAKATALNGEYPADVDFSVSVWDYAQGESISAAKPLLSRAQIRRSAAGIWAPEPAVLWPAKDRRILALAASPHGSEASISTTDGIYFSGVDTAVDQTDLLYTAPQAGLSRTSGGVVNLPFRHALCLVDFSLRCNAGTGETATLLSVTLDPVICRGDFHSLPEPEWTTAGTPVEITFFQGEQEISHNNAPAGDSRWTIPQRLTTARITVKIRHKDADEKVTERTLTSSDIRFLLERGRHYTFTLSCQLDTETLKIDIIDNLIS